MLALAPPVADICQGALPQKRCPASTSEVRRDGSQSFSSAIVLHLGRGYIIGRNVPFLNRALNRRITNIRRQGAYALCEGADGGTT